MASAIDPQATRRARDAYERWHPSVNAEESAADRPWHRLVFRYLRHADVAGRTVLEIGCGRGELACALDAAPDRPRHLVAADFAGSAVRLGRNRSREDPARPRSVSWMVGDIQQIGLPAAHFDTVISCETIEHVVDPAAALRELHRVLRPGGRLLLTTPNYVGPIGLYRGYLRLRGRRYTEGGQPISRFMLLPKTALDIRRAGFRLVAVDGIGHYALRPGRVPVEPAWVGRVERWLWPFALHSIVVAEKPRQDRTS